ncbi:chemotaxis protein CheW [Oscillospiraceae bacterium PP1C4]
MQNSTYNTKNNLMEDVDSSSMEGMFLTFWTDRQLFGIPIADVVQIVGVQEITPIPDSPVYSKGVINLRGAIIPVVDMRLRFRKAEIPYNERTCIIVANISENAVGFIVDAVEEVVHINDDQIAPPPKLSSRESSSSYLTGIGKLDHTIVLLLDTGIILSEEELVVLNDMADN